MINMAMANPWSMCIVMRKPCRSENGPAMPCKNAGCVDLKNQCFCGVPFPISAHYIINHNHMIPVPSYGWTFSQWWSTHLAIFVGLSPWCLHPFFLRTAYGHPIIQPTRDWTASQHWLAGLLQLHLCFTSEFLPQWGSVREKSLTWQVWLDNIQKILIQHIKHNRNR